MPLKYGWKNESSRIAYVKDQRKVQNSEYNKNSEKGEMTGAKDGWESSYFLEKNKTLCKGGYEWLIFRGQKVYQFDRRVSDKVAIKNKVGK